MPLKYFSSAVQSRVKSYKDCYNMAKADGKRLYGLVKPWLPLNSEYKHVDTNVTGNITGVASFLELTPISQGTDDDQRVGRSIRVTSFSGRLNILQSAADTGDNSVRLIIFAWKMDDVPVATDILSVDDEMALYNHHNTFKFRVLYDRTIDLSENGMSTRSIKMYRRVAPKHGRVKYKGSVSTDGIYNKIYLLRIARTTTNPSTATGHIRLNYLDN